MIYADVGVSTVELIFVGGISGLSLMQYFDSEMLQRITQDQASSGAFQQTSKPLQDFDEVWNAIQNWYQRDPRNGEIVWKHGVTKFDTTVPDSVDGKFRFLALLTPSRGTNKKIFCCVETNTKSLLTWDERAKVDRTDLFSNVSLVKDLRKKNNVSAEGVHNRIMRNRVTSLGPNQAAQFLGAESNKPNLDVLEDEQGDEGGDDE